MKKYHLHETVDFSETESEELLSCVWLCKPMGQAKILEWVVFPAEPQGKPKNTGVGSLSLLQWIFRTQEFSEVNSVRNMGEDLFYYHSKWLEK